MFGKFKNISLLTVLVLSITIGALLPGSSASALTRPIIFPVIGTSSYINDFNAPRGAVKHKAIDIIAKKGAPLVAAVTGTITDVQYPKPAWGYSVTIEDKDGYEFTYIHMNDDAPGTNNGKGGGMNAYAMDVREGNKVTRGQLIGKVGDSGHSNGISHLHFEMYAPSGAVLNPYSSLKAAKKISKPVTPSKQIYEMLPFGQSKIGLNIAMGNFDEDPASELVAGAGKGGEPTVKVYDNVNKALLTSFSVRPEEFRGGSDVAAGDVDGDGVDEIIVGTASSGTPLLRIYELDGTRIASFYTYSLKFKGGIHVAAGDVDGDGVDEIIVGPNAGMGPQVKIFEPDGTLIYAFNAYESTFTGGVDVAGGDVSGTTADEIITASGPGRIPRITARQIDGTRVLNFIAYDTAFRKGVRVSVGEIRTDSDKSELITIPAEGGPPSLKLFSSTGSLLAQRYIAEQWWLGNYDVAAGNETSKSALGSNRRPSIRAGIQ